VNWHRSLYWRITTGVVGFLAVMLVGEVLVYVWAVAESGRTIPGGSSLQFAQSIAQDLSAAIEVAPDLDIAHYLNEEYSRTTHPFFVTLTDGTVIGIGSEPPEAWVAATQTHLRRLSERMPAADRIDHRRDIGLRGRRGSPPIPIPPPGPEAAELGFMPVPFAVDGTILGTVTVAPRAPFTFVLTRYAPLLGLVATGVLIVSAIMTSVLVFGPPRRRLRGLEDAARRLGSGDLSVRAPERGGDEIAAVASAFNTMAEDLAERAQALEESDRVRRQLLADVSHELNTPITAMRGYLETLRMSDLELDGDTRDRYLSIISDETTRLEQLVGDLLDLARLDSGGGSIAMDRVTVAQLFERVGARHERAAMAGNVSLEMSVSPGAEAIVGDQVRLEQALQNLAANAIRYAPPRSTVRLDARPVSGRTVVISVADAGPGIAPEHVPHVFDRFYKVDPSRHEDSVGSGLGLSIVKAIVSRHGATITLTSEPGNTVFEIAGLQKA